MQMSKPPDEIKENELDVNSLDVKRTEGAAQVSDTLDKMIKGISRALIIGVGGTGHQILLDLRQRLLDEYGDFTRIPIIDFLHIDCDQSEDTKDMAYPEEIRLNDADKLRIYVNNAEELKEHIHNYPHIQSWLDMRVFDGGDINQGAGAVRARGRLAFSWNLNKISSILNSKIKKILAKESKDEATGNSLRVADWMDIYVVGSLYGGTGSGIFLDLAYLLRSLTTGMVNKSIIGIFEMPPSMGGGDMFMADKLHNAYASVLEMNHYTSPGTTFHMDTGISLGSIHDPRRPFDYCYLMDLHNGKTYLNVSDLHSMIGYYMYMDLTNEAQAAKKSARNNFDVHLNMLDRMGCPQSYLSFGIAGIVFPKDKIMRACANRLCKNIVDKLWIRRSGGAVNIANFTKNVIMEGGLDNDEIFRQLTLKEKGGSTLSEEIDTALRRLNNTYTTNYPGRNETEKFLRSFANTMLSRFIDDDPNPDVLQKAAHNVGEFVLKMQENLGGQYCTEGKIDGLLREKRAALQRIVAEMVNDPNKRHEIASDFLRQAERVFEEYIQENEPQKPAQPEDNMENPSEEKPQVQQLQMDPQIIRLLAEIRKVAANGVMWFPLPKPGRDAHEKYKDDFLLASKRFFKTHVRESAKPFMVRFYREMLQEIQALRLQMHELNLKLTKLKESFEKDEKRAIEERIPIHGIILFKNEDIDHFFAKCVKDESPLNTVAKDALKKLGITDNIFGIATKELRELKLTMLGLARNIFRELEQVEVLDEFYKKFAHDETKIKDNFLNSVHELANPFVDLRVDVDQPYEGYFPGLGKKQAVVGIQCGQDPKTQCEKDFFSLVEKTVPGFTKSQIARIKDKSIIVVIREKGGFPYRMVNGLDSYKNDYEAKKGKMLCHTRCDVTAWKRLKPPSTNEQNTFFRLFVLAWAYGIIKEKKTSQFDRYVGQKIGATYHFYYNKHGMEMEVDFGALNERKIENPDPELAPEEFEDIILHIFDNPEIRYYLEQAIDGAKVSLGFQLSANRLARFYNVNKKFKFHDKLNRIVMDEIATFVGLEQEPNPNDPGPACRKCGHVLLPREEFCISCGQSVAPAQPGYGAPGYPQTTGQPPYGAPPAQAYPPASAAPGYAPPYPGQQPYAAPPLQPPPGSYVYPPPQSGMAPYLAPPGHFPPPGSYICPPPQSGMQPYVQPPAHVPLPGYGAPAYPPQSPGAFPQAPPAYGTQSAPPDYSQMPGPPPAPGNDPSTQFQTPQQPVPEQTNFPGASPSQAQPPSQMPQMPLQQPAPFMQPPGHIKKYTNEQSEEQTPEKKADESDVEGKGAPRDWPPDKI